MALKTRQIKGKRAKRPRGRQPVRLQIDGQSDLIITDDGCSCEDCYRCQEGTGHCYVESSGCRINRHPDLSRFR